MASTNNNEFINGTDSSVNVDHKNNSGALAVTSFSRDNLFNNFS